MTTILAGQYSDLLFIFVCACLPILKYQLLMKGELSHCVFFLSKTNLQSTQGFHKGIFILLVTLGSTHYTRIQNVLKI